MTLDIIAFISSILFGIVLYWRESKSNKIYKFFNKVFNSKELQMKLDSKKGFIYEQPLLMRLVYIAVLFILGVIITQFLIPIELATISMFASGIFGTLLGTYLANFVFKSSEVIDEKGESLLDVVKDTVEKGKEFIKDLDAKDNDAVTESKQEIKEEPKETPKPKEKSARERLKDKGLM